MALALSPDGRTLASGSNAGEVILWDVFTGQLLTELQRMSRERRQPGLLPRRHRFAAGGIRRDGHGEVTVWHAPRETKDMRQVTRGQGQGPEDRTRPSPAEF